jgi:hypothetical protein
MTILQLLCSRRYCPANVPQLNCQLNYSAISSPLQNSTLDWLTAPTVFVIISRTDHKGNTILQLLSAYALPRERVYRAVGQKCPLFIRLPCSRCIATVVRAAIRTGDPSNFKGYRMLIASSPLPIVRTSKSSFVKASPMPNLSKHCFWTSVVWEFLLI